MNTTAKKVLIGSISALGALTVASATSYTMTRSLVKVAIDRAPNMKPSPKVKEIISGSKRIDEIERLCKAGAPALERGDCRTVSIKGYGGERLVGHWHTCEGAKRTIVAMHGWRTSWSRDFGAVSGFWHNSGCNVLYAEQRAQNNSGGTHIGFGLTERFDCLLWARWVNTQEGCSSLPIYLCGVSMGATTVLMASALDLPANVSGIIADCGFTSPQEIWKHVAKNNLHLSYHALRAAVVRDVCKRMIQMSPDGYSTIDAMQRCKVPVLFVHGTDDSFVPIRMTYENYKACTAPKRLLVVPGADHGMSYFLDRENYEAEMRKFWQDFDR